VSPNLPLIKKNNQKTDSRLFTTASTTEQTREKNIGERNQEKKEAETCADGWKVGENTPRDFPS
jgi:hypothetical protein